MSVFIADLIDHMSENYFCESEAVSLHGELHTHTHTKKQQIHPHQRMFNISCWKLINYESTNQLATLS